jgi:hypothetical protein
MEETKLEETVEVLNKVLDKKLVLKNLNDEQKELLLNAKLIYEESKKYETTQQCSYNTETIQYDDCYELAAAIGNTTREKVKERWDTFFN